MQITVKLFASFRKKWGREIVRKHLPGTRILDVVSTIGIPDDESFIIVLNGVHASLNDPLHEGDILSFMPLIEKGKVQC